MHRSSDIHSRGEGQIIKYKYPVKGAYTAVSACLCILTLVITGLWAIFAINLSWHDNLPQFYLRYFCEPLLSGAARRCATVEETRGKRVQCFRLSSAGSAVNRRDQSGKPRRFFFFFFSFFVVVSPNYTWQVERKLLDWWTKLFSTCN